MKGEVNTQFFFETHFEVNGILATDGSKFWIAIAAWSQLGSPKQRKPLGGDSRSCT